MDLLHMLDVRAAKSWRVVVSVSGGLVDMMIGVWGVLGVLLVSVVMDILDIFVDDWLIMVAVVAMMDTKLMVSWVVLVVVLVVLYSLLMWHQSGKWNVWCLIMVLRMVVAMSVVEVVNVVVVNWGSVVLWSQMELGAVHFMALFGNSFKDVLLVLALELLDLGVLVGVHLLFQTWDGVSDSLVVSGVLVMVAIKTVMHISVSVAVISLSIDMVAIVNIVGSWSSLVMWVPELSVVTVSRPGVVGSILTEVTRVGFSIEVVVMGLFAESWWGVCWVVVLELLCALVV
jgi:hypothetical protein